MQRQQRTYLGKRGVKLLIDRGVPVSVIRELKQLDHGLPVISIQREQKRLSHLSTTNPLVSASELC